jgi:hypothetical protein
MAVEDPMLKRTLQFMDCRFGGKVVFLGEKVGADMIIDRWG